MRSANRPRLRRSAPSRLAASEAAGPRLVEPAVARFNYLTVKVERPRRRRLGDGQTASRPLGRRLATRSLYILCSTSGSDDQRPPTTYHHVQITYTHSAPTDIHLS
ncbi:unnamed protein product [Danaus chrysippus]|uniref:(African queen) hypothetical protein n=1 Tax=Danaus chrysippus TaxID=151541 RepID=A0A8J2VZP9_9NEOP|nr:unnamed protein product [Danaus chrysippus]